MTKVVGQADLAETSAGDRRHPGRDVRHAGRAVRAAGNGARPAQADDGGRARVERSSRARSTACIAATVPIATASPATATARRRRSSIPIRATIAPACSSSRAPTRPRSRPTKTCAASCTTAFPARRCRRSRCCRPTKSNALVEYVKYLSIRGQMETALVNYVADEARRRRRRSIRRTTPSDARSSTGCSTEIVDGWNERRRAGHRAGRRRHSGRQPHARADRRVGRRRPRAVLRHARPTACKCHGPTGLGDGQQTDYDDWSKANNEFIKDTDDDGRRRSKRQKQELAKLKGEERKRPRPNRRRSSSELRRAARADRRTCCRRGTRSRATCARDIYRGGRRPIDLFWRISAGIAGTPMPAGGPAAPGAQGTLTEQEIWQIVDYVQSLPFEPASRPQQRPVNVEAVN